MRIEDFVESLESMLLKELSICDYHVQVKFNYLNDLLCELSDEMMRLEEDIVKSKIDEEIAEKLWKINYDSKDLKDVHKARDNKAEAEKNIELINEKYDIIEEMYEKMIFELLLK